MRRVLLALVVGAFAAGGAAAQEGGSFKLGSWEGGVFLNDQKAFSHCAATQPYKNGINLIVALTQSGEWRLGFMKPGVNMTTGESGTVGLAFDGGRTLKVPYEVTQPTLLIVGMPVNSNVLAAFRGARRMEFTLGTTKLYFDLDQTSRLMPVLSECLRNKAVPQSVAVPTQSAALTTQPPVTTTTTPPPPPQAPSSQATDIIRKKLLSEASAEYGKCRQTQIRSTVPFSEDSPENLAQAIREKCAEAEDKFVSLGVALLSTPRTEMQDAVAEALADQKQSLASDVVTFRAELAKAIAEQPRTVPSASGETKSDSSQ